MRVWVRNRLGQKQRLFLSFGNEFKFGREGARRLRHPGAKEAFADKEVEGVLVASEKAGFGRRRGSLVFMANLSITAKRLKNAMYNSY